MPERLYYRRHLHPLEGQKCPQCGLKYEFCEIEDCNNFARYEGWVKEGDMLRRRHLCKEHAFHFEGYKSNPNILEELENATNNNQG